MFHFPFAIFCAVSLSHITQVTDRHPRMLESIGDPVRVPSAHPRSKNLLSAQSPPRLSRCEFLALHGTLRTMNDHRHGEDLRSARSPLPSPRRPPRSSVVKRRGAGTASAQVSALFTLVDAAGLLLAAWVRGTAASTKRGARDARRETREARRRDPTTRDGRNGDSGVGRNLGA